MGFRSRVTLKMTGLLFDFLGGLVWEVSDVKI